MYLLRYKITLKLLFYINKGIISDKLQNMSDTKQRVIADNIDKVNSYLDEGWVIVSIHTTNTTTIFLLEKDLTLK